jgi:hypothetical protein
MVTDRLSETEFLRRVRAELGRVYHDICNPLAVVSGNLELVNELRKAGLPPEEMMDSIADAHTGVAGFTAPLESLMTLRALLDERIDSADE